MDGDFEVGLEAPRVVTTLPLFAEEGDLVVLSRDGRMYQYRGNHWSRPAIEAEAENTTEWFAKLKQVVKLSEQAAKEGKTLVGGTYDDGSRYFVINAPHQREIRFSPDQYNRVLRHLGYSKHSEARAVAAYLVENARKRGHRCQSPLRPGNAWLEEVAADGW